MRSFAGVVPSTRTLTNDESTSVRSTRSRTAFTRRPTDGASFLPLAKRDDSGPRPSCSAFEEVRTLRPCRPRRHGRRAGRGSHSRAMPRKEDK
jgi:hypothetical protein